jgi:hypothetical protein
MQRPTALAASEDHKRRRASSVCRLEQHRDVRPDGSTELCHDDVWLVANAEKVPDAGDIVLGLV